MTVVGNVTELRALVTEQRRIGKRIGFVPTMGNLHAGHYSLVEKIREHCDFVVASVFVNPTQFGVNEDFSRYPRTPEQDARGLEKNGCDVLFVPEVEAVYPFGIEHSVRVSVPDLGDILEGASRPGHFDGVASVVARLFNQVQPDVAIFGSKDYQQLLVIRRLSADLGFPVEIVGAPIVREANGLAMSSRNQFLDAGQRERAANIHATLTWVADQLEETWTVGPSSGATAGVIPSKTSTLKGLQPSRMEWVEGIESAAMKRLSDAGFEPIYVSIRRAEDLGQPTVDTDHVLVILIAARLGGVRLIDNLIWTTRSMS